MAHKPIYIVNVKLGFFWLIPSPEHDSAASHFYNFSTNFYVLTIFFPVLFIYYLFLSDYFLHGYNYIFSVSCLPTTEDTRTRHKDCTVRIRPECRDVFRGQRVFTLGCVVELLVGMRVLVRLGRSHLHEADNVNGGLLLTLHLFLVPEYRPQMGWGRDAAHLFLSFNFIIKTSRIVGMGMGAKLLISCHCLGPSEHMMLPACWPPTHCLHSLASCGLDP